MTTTYTWSANVLITGHGLHDARGAHRAKLPASEAELKAAVARDIAKRHRCTATDVDVLEFTYSEVPA
ncbi:hypothetical protein ACIBAC_11500 [Streptomyces sp. NPDC051362]|uniref:hypothetical protein n=1 Tax=Streptomyces sp. NPDC051362 TaxID=3365651 RepID=UPI0037A3A851